MLSLILNIVGIILIIYAIFVIKKDMSLKKKEEREIKEKKEENIEAYNPVEKLAQEFDQEEFDKIFYQKLKNTDLEKKPIEKDTNYEKLIIKEDVLSEENNINPLHKKIIELKSIGLSNEEIARKLGRGIREIDIILKIYKI